MVKIVKFVYVIIIFISLFFIAKNVEGRVKCIKDYGCQNKSCQFPLKPYIRTGRVTCKNDSGCELKLYQSQRKYVEASIVNWLY
ncbi:Nodule Cysteine-Rich (NCR) secreted peptide [Medicago truncatula]|uniref:Nodule Cysteine-Rich (NCR) secreted peptide n=1 Tax=Medicago truncatula TaxID=3880 RepID=A0A072V8Q0_MEDTR|nr:Nodule Cysteine-Rich (NCR) secreted peptide [Medicago truncatula]